jgi:NAD(P)-dependent dehydrogenase (short-subunit alcohol dehydrogenase family)
MTDVQPLDGPVSCLQAGGGKAEGMVGDVSSEAFVASLAARVAQAHGAADVLVNNAGISMIQPAEDTTAEQWQRVMNVNLLGPFLLCKHFGRQMLARRSGSIVNVASVAGLGGVIHRAAYNASKHGLIGLTRTLAGEWGGRGVRVNAVCPGWIKTEMDVKDMGSGAYTDDDIIDRVFPLYQAQLAKENAVDFNDLLLKVLDLFAHDKSGKALRVRFRHVLVDEFQDTNRAQLRLLELLCAPGAGGRSGRRLRTVDRESRLRRRETAAGARRCADLRPRRRSPPGRPAPPAAG